MTVTRKGIRLFSAVLVMSLLLGLLPGIALPAAAETRGLTLEELKEKFPHGMFWNGPNPDGWTTVGCTHHRSGCSYDGSCGCNTFRGQSTQCMGFAEKLAYDASGYNPRKNENGWYTYTGLSALNHVKPGDIIRSRGHSVYVIDVQGTTITFADCNYDGNCNIRWDVTKDISYFRDYFSHVRSAPSALTSGYLAQCERLSSEGTVEIFENAELWTSPCTQEIYENSEQSGELSAGSKVSVYALYCNSQGEYWYKISYNNAVRYLPAAHTQNFAPHTDTISALDVVKPVNVKYKNGFSIDGLIRAESMTLTHVGAYVYSGMDMTGEPVLVSEDTQVDQVSYQIAGSTVDKNLTFGQLEKGTYTYVLRATAANQYADRGELATWSTTQTLHRNIFVVSDTKTGDYAKSCHIYSSAGTVVLKEDAVLRNVPCNPETNPAAVEIAQMEAGMRIQVTGLYRNSLDDYWYETQYGGLNCYIFAGNTVSFRLYSDEVLISDVYAPTHNVKGKSFAVQGLVSSYALPLAVVGAYVYAGTDIDAEAILAGEDTQILDEDDNPSHFYDLTKSNVDYFLTFGKLPVGEYTYVIKAYTRYYYADENVRTPILQEHILHRNTFTVSDSVTCTHSYTEEVTQPATCVTDGQNTYTCSQCGYAYILHTFANGIHVMTPWETLIPPTCTQQGYAIRNCTGCEITESDFLPVTDHSYQQTVTPPQSGEPGYITYTCTACGHSYTDSYTELSAAVSQWNVTLGDDLQANFHMQYDQSVSDDAQVHVTVAGQTQVFAKADVISVHIAAAQMTDDVTVQVIDGENASQQTSYTVAQYAYQVLQDETMSNCHELVRQMLCYGAAAQSYFAYNTDRLADGDITDIRQEEVPAEADAAITIADELAEMDFYGATLLFRNKIALRLYFTAAEDITGYTFTANGKTLTPVEKDGKYCVEIGDILPQDLDKPITVTVGEGLSVTYSPMHYMINMSKRGSETMKALAKALYNYHLAAKALAE